MERLMLKSARFLERARKLDRFAKPEFNAIAIDAFPYTGDVSKEEYDLLREELLREKPDGLEVENLFIRYTNFSDNAAIGNIRLEDHFFKYVGTEGEYFTIKTRDGFDLKKLLSDDKGWYIPARGEGNIMPLEDEVIFEPVIGDAIQNPFLVSIRNPAQGKPLMFVHYPFQSEDGGRKYFSEDYFHFFSPGEVFNYNTIKAFDLKLYDQKTIFSMIKQD